MRAPSDMPPPRRRRKQRLSSRARVILIVVAVGLLVLITSLRGIAGFYTDYLWFDSLGQEDTFRTMLGAKLSLALIFIGLFFVLAFANLVIADRIAPRFRPIGPEEELLRRYHEIVDDRSGWVRAGVALMFAVIAGAGASAQWNEWLLFTNRVDFGIQDPQFHTDIGFYVFQLPFLSFVVSWLFAALVIILIITAVAHYLNGGIRVQNPGPRVTDRVKAHISVLLALLALVKAADYWLQRYELTLSTRGTVDGALYTDVKAQLPAIYLLLMIAGLSVGLLIVNIWRRGWVLPVLAVGLWGFVAVVVGTIYPAGVQRFKVDPAESSREAVYIERNIEATRAAMGLADVATQPFDYNEDLDSQGLLDNEETVRNIRLLDPGVVGDTYQQLQAERSFYELNDLDVDRYDINGETTQVVISARELNTSGVPQQSWEGQRVAYTHGYGAAVAPANAVTSEGRPDFIVDDIPVNSSVPALEVDQAGIYVGEDLDGYSIVGATRDEIDYQSAEGDTVTSRYDGTGGVGMGSLLRRAAFALRFGEIEPLISNFVDDDSRIIYIRDIRERVGQMAPFLHWDADPYPVIIDGRIQYVLDAYTTTPLYPYAQRADTDQLPPGSGLDHSFNYVRNSVKAVVDSYDGTVDLYVVDEEPIVEAYSRAFPDLFTDMDEMPEELREHLRYPEDLFRVQTTAWGRYHIDGAQNFYEQTGGWVVAQNPGASTAPVTAEATTDTTETGDPEPSRERRIDPQYLLMRLPGEEEEDFLILRSFVPNAGDTERRELTAFMVAKSDPENYGEIEVFEMQDTNIAGPAIVDSNIRSNDEISREITLLDQQGSNVQLGNLLLIPVEQSILYVRPLYTQAESSTPVPLLRRVIVAYGDEVVMERTLREALTEIFGDAPETLEAEPDDPADPADPADPEEPEGDEPELEPSEEVASLLAEADDLFVQADEALADSDLEEYGRLIAEARDLIEEALTLSGGETPTTTTEAPGAA
jgi:uncharacterized membrane protein (UPF0182 family)